MTVKVPPTVASLSRVALPSTSKLPPVDVLPVARMIETADIVPLNVELGVKTNPEAEVAVTVSVKVSLPAVPPGKVVLGMVCPPKVALNVEPAVGLPLTVYLI